MSDIDTIKARIRKLMAVAGDGVATDGEIDNAMRLAAKLLDAHHLLADDIPGAEEEKDSAMGRAHATTQTSRVSTWECALANALCKLFGCVNYYSSHETAPVRVGGVAQIDKSGEIKRGKKLYFYGPLVESGEAADLFNEWSRSIATMGVIRWGGAFKGDGANYCYGFALALLNKAHDIHKDRAQVEAKPLKLLGSAPSGAITLAKRYDLLADAGKKWLKEEAGVHLTKGSSRGGYRGSDDAFNEGKSHGQAANFNRTTKRRMLPE